MTPYKCVDGDGNDANNNDGHFGGDQKWIYDSSASIFFDQYR